MPAPIVPATGAPAVGASPAATGAAAAPDEVALLQAVVDTLAAPTATAPTPKVSYRPRVFAFDPADKTQSAPGSSPGAPAVPAAPLPFQSPGQPGTAPSGPAGATGPASAIPIAVVGVVPPPGAATVALPGSMPLAAPSEIPFHKPATGFLPRITGAIPRIVRPLTGTIPLPWLTTGAAARTGIAQPVPGPSAVPGAQHVPPAGPGLFGLSGDGAPSRAPKIALYAGIIALVLLGGYATMAWAFGDKVPRETTVVGVALGGQTEPEAVQTLQEALAPRAAEPLQLTAGEASTTLDPAASGLAVDAEATVDELTGFSFSPARMWQHLFGGSEEELVLAVDQEKLDAAVAALSESMAVAPVDGTVVFADGAAAATPAVAGTTVVAEQAEEILTSHWMRRNGPFDLPVEEVQPEITQAETDEALAQAEQIVSAPVVVAVGGQNPELPAAALAGATSFSATDGTLQPTFDGAKLVEAIVDRTNDLLTEPDEAHFEFQGGQPVIVGGEQGTTLDPTALADAVRTAALGEDRSTTVDLVERDPADSRAALEALGVKEVISSFDTPLTNDQVRTANLVRGAQMVTGTLIKPGETFSLIEALSPITVANGYVASGIVSSGQHTEGVGGGLSQMATTTYNAGFFAGFDDVEHHQHSYWFTRYPAGREATIFVGAKDMRFTNDSPYGALMQSWVANGRLYVQIWSTKHFRVETSASAKSNVVATTPVQSSSADCMPYPGGEAGFRITNYRKVYTPDGKLVKDEADTHTYNPDNPMSCVGGGQGGSGG